MAGTLPIAPLRLEAGERLAWHAETDLLVVGFGGAGAANTASMFVMQGGFVPDIQRQDCESAR